MQVAVGFGWEAGKNRFVFACLQIGGNNFFQKVQSFFFSHIGRKGKHQIELMRARISLIFRIRDENEVGKRLVHHEQAAKLVRVFIGASKILLFFFCHQFALNKLV